MDPHLLQTFFEQTRLRIPEVRERLRTAALDDFADLSQVRGQLIELARKASDLGLIEVAGYAGSLDAEVARFQHGSSLEPAIALLTKLEAALLRASLDDGAFSLDIGGLETVTSEPIPDPEPFSFSIDDFDARPSDAPEAALFVTAPEVSAPEFPPQPMILAEDQPAADLFDVDPELLEVFAEEAEDLLKNIDASLENLSRDPADSDSLWEIRRNAHTFKGSAGIVGLKQLSEVAHRVEDLLDRMAETKCGSNERIIKLLHASTECLKALVAGENSPTLFKSISQLYYDFDGILANLGQQETSATVAEVTGSEPEVVEEPLVDEPLFVHTALAPSLDLAAIERLLAPPVLELQTPRNPHSRSVVRVSLERLDDLVRIVRDMLISRSVYEQNLKSLERQIDDLHNATRRLQATSSKLEIDFEATMMSSGSGLARPGSIPGLSTPGSFDELEFDKYTDFHQSTRDLAETTSDTFSINSSLDLLRGGFESVLDEHRHLIDELQQWLLHVRMVEFGSLTTRLQRAVRVTCDEEGKQAELRVKNESLEVDTQILDSLIEPLMHLLKNSVVHGIEDPETRRVLGKPENGSIEVSVENDETHIVITISDDGRGISPEAVKEKAVALGDLSYEEASKLSDEDALELIFLPGLSTADKVNLSAGRGVGMSIVKESVQAGRGSVSIDSYEGRGTTFTVRMPLALAVTKVLLAKVGESTYALPLKPITFVTELTDDLFTGIDGKKVDIQGKKLPLLQLSSFLGNDPVAPAELLGKPALMYESSDRSCAIAVEEVRGTEEIVIKPLAKPLDKVTGILGAAILGSGELVPIIDMPSLLKRKVSRDASVQAPPKPAEKTVSILIVDDSPSVRHMTSKVVQSAGWQAKTAKDGLDALEQLKAMETLPAVILSDIEMPRMDGYEFAASLQRSDRFGQIPVIMITSRTANKHRERALESGVSQYLTKPFEDRELIDSIKILGQLT
jgi:chemosensory pili system protein ChpA (sensor histidine kinase/response regulator)